MKALIARIDVPQRSVILEVQIIELSDSSAADRGLDLTGGSTEIADASTSFSTGGLPQFNAHLQASLYDTIAKGGGKILAAPRILALSGTSAQILTGDALPIITTTTFPGPPVTTQQSVTYISVGVNLQIQPRVTDDGNVTSHIFAEVSSVTALVPTQQGNVPQISLREAATVATVSDGDPFVIGGLLKDEEIRNLSKIPGIGDLPLLGGLFRVRHDTGTLTNLYIVVTPHILGHQGNPPPSGLERPIGPGGYPSPPR
jgi:general secretion pathway protein D